MTIRGVALIRMTAISVGTLAGFVAIVLLGPSLFDRFSQSSGGYARLLEMLIYIYAPQLGLVVALALAIQPPSKLARTIGLNRGFLPGLTVSLILTLPMLVTLAVTGGFSPPQDVWVQAVRSSVFPGFFEELIFRAMLFGFLFRFAGWGFLPAALAGAALFGLGHLYQANDAIEALGVFAFTAIGGVWFAWLYSEWRFNLWVPIGFHTFMNLWWMLFSVSDSAIGPLAANIARLVVIVLSVIVTVLVARRRGGFVVSGRSWLIGGPRSVD